MSWVKYLLSLVFCFSAGISTFSQESVRITTDRDYYIAGEPLWIKLDCLSNADDSIACLSTTAYVEVLNKNNAPVLRNTLYLEKGKSETRLFIPDSIKSGNYQIRTYTSWMKNYNPNYYASKAITVINPFKSNKYPKSVSSYSNDTILFYPEGGKWISSIDNQLVFQVLDKYGEPRELNAYITNQLEDTIYQVKTNNTGFAKVRINPKKKFNYRINYLIDSAVVSRKIPIKFNDGVVLHLKDNKTNQLSFEVKGRSSFDGYLDIVSSNGDSITSVVCKGSVTIVKTDNLPKGYLCAYLYDRNKQLTASRYFILDEKQLVSDNQIILSDSSYSTKEKVGVEVKDIKELYRSSVSVVRTDLLHNQRYIHNPYSLNDIPSSILYSWTSDNVKVNDLLQCFKVIENVHSEYRTELALPEIEGKYLTGTIRNRANKEVLIGVPLVLNYVGSSSQMDISKTDSLGRFRFCTNQFDEKEVVIQPLSKVYFDSVNYIIELDDCYSDEYGDYSLPSFTLSKVKADAINTAFINMQINGIYNSNNEVKIEDKEDTLSFYRSPEIEVPISKYIELSSIEEILKEIVPMVFLQKKKGKHSIFIEEPVGINKSDGETYVLVDGILITDVEKVLQIKAEDIERIEVVNLNYYYKGYELGRILSIYTKDSDLSTLEFDDNIFRQSHDFYAPIFEFKPVALDEIENHLPDYRNVLYWSTEVNDSHFSFFTSDSKGNYTIVVEGINAHGVAERYEKSFQVE